VLQRIEDGACGVRAECEEQIGSSGCRAVGGLLLTLPGRSGSAGCTRRQRTRGGRAGDAGVAGHRLIAWQHVSRC
jgi:hypothetical protein